MDDTHLPPQFWNICEGSGYFWFGAITPLLALGTFKAGSISHHRTLYVLLFVPLVFLLAWATLELPAKWGHFFFLDKVQSTRVIPALGLINVSITVVFLRLAQNARQVVGAKSTFRRLSLLGAACSIGYFLLLWAMNRAIGGFFARSDLAIAALMLGATTVALAEGRPRLFAVAVLAPLLWSNLLINPVDRGLGIYQQSALRAFVDTHPCKDGRWLVVSRNADASQYFAALGLDVFNIFHYVPFLDLWKHLDPRGERTSYYNGSGTTVVEALPPGSEIRIEAVPGVDRGPPLFKRLCVAPADTGLYEIGIRYFAFHGAPDPTLFPDDRFERMTEAPVDGFTVYRSRAP